MHNIIGKIEKDTIICFLTGFGFFLLTNLPSLKLIHSTEAWNIIAFAILSLPAGLSLQKSSSREKYHLSIIFFLFFFVFICSLLVNKTLYEIDQGKYAYFAAMIFLCIAVARVGAIKHYLIITICWSGLLAGVQLFKGININESLGQTYLTISMPLGIALSLALIKSLTTEKIKIISRLFYISYSILIIFALLTLHSRSAILYPLLVCISLTTLMIILSRPITVKSKFIIGGIFLLLTVILYKIFILFSSELIKDRIFRLLENISEEPRIEIYNYAFTLIQNEPVIGYGRGDIGLLKDWYVHNIFLDITIHGGMFMLSFFLIFTIWYLKCGYNVLRNFPSSSLFTSLLGCSLFSLLQWSSSFNLSNSYIPISLMILFVVSYSKIHYASKKLI